MLLGPVFTDNREKTPPPEQRVAELAQLGVPAVVANLSRGDYQWVVTPEPKDALPALAVVAERKSIRDLIASAVDGRIARFFQGAVDDAGLGAEQMNVLLVEGDQFRVSGYGAERWTPGRLDNLLADLQYEGVVVLRSRSEADTAERLAEFWRHTGQPNRAGTLRKVLGPRADGNYLNANERLAVQCIMGLPGWGEAKARAAVSVLGSPSAVLLAILSRDHKAFTKVPGVGRGLVESAYTFLTRAVA